MKGYFLFLPPSFSSLSIESVMALRSGEHLHTNVANPYQFRSHSEDTAAKNPNTSQSLVPTGPWPSSAYHTTSPAL